MSQARDSQCIFPLANPVTIHLHTDTINADRTLLYSLNFIISMQADAQIAKTFRSMSIRYGSNTSVSDRCLIDGDPMEFVIGVSSTK